MGAARATLTLEDSEWSRKFEEPWQEGWGRFFFKAASKGLPRPFNVARWRCSKVETPIHDSIRELITWECKEHGMNS